MEILDFRFTSTCFYQYGGIFQILLHESSDQKENNSFHFSEVTESQLANIKLIFSQRLKESTLYISMALFSPTPHFLANANSDLCYF